MLQEQVFDDGGRGARIPTVPALIGQIDANKSVRTAIDVAIAPSWLRERSQLLSRPGPLPRVVAYFSVYSIPHQESYRTGTCGVKCSVHHRTIQC